MDTKGKREELQKALENHKAQMLLITGYLTALDDLEKPEEPKPE